MRRKRIRGGNTEVKFDFSHNGRINDGCWFPELKGRRKNSGTFKNGNLVKVGKMTNSTNSNKTTAAGSRVSRRFAKFRHKIAKNFKDRKIDEIGINDGRPFPGFNKFDKFVVLW